MSPESLESRLALCVRDADGALVNPGTGRVVSAIVPMHTFGHPCSMNEIKAIGEMYNLPVVEDAAESLGSWIGNRHTGTFGSLGVISFNGNKIVTTGGGGAVLTNDVALADKLKHLTTTAKIPHAWEYAHDQIGYNYRMPNLNAALGCAQLAQLPDFIESKRRLTEIYADLFSDLDEITIMLEPDGCTSNYWLQTAILCEGIEGLKDELLKVANENGIGCRPAWRLISDLIPYKDCPRGSLTVAESLARRIINFPSSSGLA